MLVGRTHFGGAFLLLPAALALSRIAERTLKRALGSKEKARRLALSLFFRAALGIERIFHFETLDDLGFAILSGGKKVMSRSSLGGLMRAVSTAGVKNFARATEELRALRNRVVTLSVDEHVIARFTRKFKIPKGFHTIRNKKSRRASSRRCNRGSSTCRRSRSSSCRTSRRRRSNRCTGSAPSRREERARR